MIQFYLDDECRHIFEYEILRMPTKDNRLFEVSFNDGNDYKWIDNLRGISFSADEDKLIISDGKINLFDIKNGKYFLSIYCNMFLDN